MSFADLSRHAILAASCLTATQLRANIRPIDFRTLPDHERSILMAPLDGFSSAIQSAIGQTIETKDSDRLLDLDRHQDHRLIPVASGDG
jgi:hypothetical protein